MMKRIVLGFMIMAAAYAALNFDYFRKQVSYEFSKNDYATTTADTIREKMEPDTVIVPSLNIKAPIKYAAEVNEDKFQELLIDGVVHYPGTADIGKPGNAYIFGHSSDNAWSKGKYKTVFALLPKIKIGDEMVASDREGNKFVYKVIDARVVAKNDTSVLAQDNSKKLLTLQTSYPVGTSLKRFVAVGELVK